MKAAGYVIFEIIAGRGTGDLSNAVGHFLDENKQSGVVADYWANT